MGPTRYGPDLEWLFICVLALMGYFLLFTRHC